MARLISNLLLSSGSGLCVSPLSLSLSLSLSDSPSVARSVSVSVSCVSPQTHARPLHTQSGAMLAHIFMHPHLQAHACMRSFHSWVREWEREHMAQDDTWALLHQPCVPSTFHSHNVCVYKCVCMCAPLYPPSSILTSSPALPPSFSLSLPPLAPALLSNAHSLHPPSLPRPPLSLSLAAGSTECSRAKKKCKLPHGC